MISDEKLAIHGGVPVRKTPIMTWPQFVPDEIEAVSQVLASGKVNYWTGEQGRCFEQEFAACCRVRYGVALANGTVALEAAIHGLGIGPGDEVIVTPRSFIASASSIILQGAIPVFADVDRVSQNITAETIRPCISAGTKAIIAVHLAGWPCDMDPIMALAAEHGLKVIEDCAQAHGAAYKGRQVGSLGDAAAFSFCQDKIMTTGGEGGMLLTGDAGLHERVWSYKDHGKKIRKTRQAAATGFQYVHDSFGTNGRMTEMQAAIGRCQLRRLAGWVEQRRRNGAVLTAGFRKIPALRLTEPSSDYHHSYYKYYAFVRPERLRRGWHRDRIIAAVRAEGIPCFTGSCPEIYRENAFIDAGIRPAESLPVAGELGATSLMFLVHPTLGEVEMRHTCRAVAKVMTVAAA